MEHGREQYGRGAQTGAGCATSSRINHGDKSAAARYSGRPFSSQDRAVYFPVPAATSANLGPEKILRHMSRGITEAVILMAGSGSRFSKGERKRLKPLLPLFGRPLISYMLEALAEANIEKIYAVIGY